MDQLVEIALATYNGAKYIGDFLESLLKQTYPLWRLIVRDDGSTDATRDILDTFKRDFPERIILIQDEPRNLGVHGNFNQVLLHSEAEYVMLADQDDIWLPTKVERTLSVMQSLSKKFGNDIPLLVHTDLKVINAQGEVLAPSFWKYQNLDPNFSTLLNRLLVQNVVTGCTVMVNRALLERALPIPGEAIMHDWWLGLVAAAFGKVAYIEEPTILYRQHGANDTGAKRWGLPYILKKLREGAAGLRTSIHRTQVQAKAFLDRFKEDLDPRLFDQVSKYAELGQMGYLQRRLVAFKYGFFKVGLVRNIGFYVAM
ncbi:MAG: glycosyltransferase family 2 protein [Ammonifex sp.]|jgi:glycosyltransferase involved in cell wall biosynthesis|nr:MAG: glycosyltransferase family 2 protein [Ammonifex sp.]